MTRKAQYLVSVAAVALAVIVSIPGAQASCPTPYDFGQFSAGTYFYTFMPTTSLNTQSSIIGHFWEVGKAATDNDVPGCPDDAWFRVCPGSYPCGGNPTGKTRYILGHVQTTGCFTTGCPGLSGGDLNTLVQDTTSDGKTFFALARVSKLVGPQVVYDYTRLNSNITLVELPRPSVTASSRAGSTVNLNLTLPSVSAGFKGLSGQTAQGVGNISGYRILTFTGNADPGRVRTNWVADGVSRPYTGSPVLVTAFPVNCSNTALDVFVAMALEFDNGTVTSDYASASMRVECDPTISNPNRFRSLDKPASGIKQAPR